MLYKKLLIKLPSRFLLPYILTFSIYIQINGEVSPGGGFQAASICAAVLIAYNLLYQKLPFNTKQLKFFAALGTLIYSSVGLVSFLNNDNYLNYYSLPGPYPMRQKIGIFMVEFGIGLTITAIMVTIYSSFRGESKK